VTNPIRVLVVDDSATLRRALAKMLGEDPALRIVGEASDGMEAVKMAASLRPDVITMDVDMPGLDGLAATAAIMAESPARVLIVCSVGEARQLDLSFRAIAAGALELMSKPAAGEDLRRWGLRVAESVRLMAEVPVVRRRTAGARPAGATAHEVDVFGLVASTGGPPALVSVLGALPKNLRIPLLVAQHMAEGFTPGLLRWFSQTSPLPVALAQDGAAPRPGHVYLPPDGHDLELDERGLLRAPRAGGVHRPSANRLLHSLARACGARAGGVVLTGMGDDGAQGLLAIRNAGGPTYAQDEATCIVFGMPQAALLCGATSSLVPLDAVAWAILRHAGVTTAGSRGA
jgi:two-component system chemotaxis response regulator CheB